MNQFTAAHAAAMHGHADILELLLAAGADPNAQTEPQKYAPLHSAAFAGHDEAIRVLLARCARADLRNYRGETPAETAGRNHHVRTVALLADNKAPARGTLREAAVVTHLRASAPRGSGRAAPRGAASRARPA
jgi:ankyrin repeat protein